MSTPLTAGVVALIRQYLKRVYPNNKPSGALLKAILIHGAVPIAGQYNPPEVGPVPDMNQGWGRVSLTGSLFPDYPTYMMFYDLPSSALATGDSKLYSFNLLKGTVPLKVTLVWTDPPKTMAAGSDIVNKLQLSVTKPDGAVVYGTPDVNTKPNNVQQVLLSSLPLATGTYKMKVYGLNVTSAEKQDFALVVSGGLELADLYIRDNPSDTGVPPLPRRLNQSPDILYKIIALNPGYKIQVQVKVHNRGSAKVNQAKVRLYYAIKSSARQRIWPLPAPSWLTAGITINGVPGNEQSLDVPARGSTTDGVATTDKFESSVSATDAINAIKAGKPFGLAATVGLKRGLSLSGVNAWGNDYAAKIPKNTEFP